MAKDKDSAEKPARTGTWTDDEKVKVLFQIIFQLKKIDWKNFVPPPGRDKRSCQNMIDTEKRRLGISTKAAQEAAEADGDGGNKLLTPKNESNDNDSPLNMGSGETGEMVTPTPTKKKAAPRKRKVTTVDPTDDNGNAEAMTKEKPAKKKRASKAKVKKEVDDEAEHKLPEVGAYKSKDLESGMDTLGGYEAEDDVE